MNIITELKIFKLLRDTAQQIRKVTPTDSHLSATALVAVLGILAASLTQLAPLVPEQWKHYIAVSLVILGAAGSVLNVFVNPDGTPASTPWEKKDK